MRTLPNATERARPTGEEARALMLAGMPVQERRLELAGVSTAVLEGGDGSPVVLLHGPGEFATGWLRVIPDLVSTHRVIAPDLLGHGESQFTNARLGTRRVLDWLDELPATRDRQGALDEIATMATEKVPAFSDRPLAGNPVFQHEFADAHAWLRAARALHAADASEAWETALADQPFTPELRARIRATAVWVTRAAVKVVDTAYTAGGGSALYSSSPLQRRFRDIHALTQHFAVKADTLTLAGAVLLGQDVDLSFL